jgi:hypothetical protein
MSDQRRHDVQRLVSFSASAASGVLIAQSSAIVFYMFATPPMLGGYTVPFAFTFLSVSAVAGIISTLGLGYGIDHLFHFFRPTPDPTPISPSAPSPVFSWLVVAGLSTLWGLVLIVSPICVEWWAFSSYAPLKIGLSVLPVGVAFAKLVSTSGRRRHPV